MPIKVVKYRCKFKCGTLAMHDLKTAEKHEDGCYKNPDNKTCETCVNRIYQRDGDDYSTWHWRDCKLPTMSSFIEEIHDFLEMKNGVHHIKPLWKCPNHNQSTEVPETSEYILSVTEKIELKIKELQKEKEGLPF